MVNQYQDYLLITSQLFSGRVTVTVTCNCGQTTINNQTLQFNTKYRVLKTSWGIAIDIEATFEEIASDKNILTFSEQSLTPNEKEQIIMGLEDLLSVSDLGNKKYTIDIQKVLFNPCDFQVEGLYWASRDWLSKALNIKTMEPEISFDKTSNKYFFRLAGKDQQ